MVVPPDRQVVGQAGRLLSAIPSFVHKLLLGLLPELVSLPDEFSGSLP
jgi:hypothetical protein